MTRLADLARAILMGANRGNEAKELATLVLAAESAPAPLPWSVATRDIPIDDYETHTLWFVVDAFGVAITQDRLGSEVVADFGQGNAELIVEAVNSLGEEPGEDEPRDLGELVGAR